MVNSFILNFIEDKIFKTKTYVKYRKYKRMKYKIGDIFIILGCMAIPIIPATILKNLYMDFWKFTNDLRDFYRSWLLFVIKRNFFLSFKNYKK